MRHSCAKKKKFEETNDVVVQHAYRGYTYWMASLKLSKRGKEPTIDKFLKSTFKKSFVKMVMFTRDNKIMSLYTYIDWLIKCGTRESNWFDEDEHKLDAFRKYADEYEDPVDQAFATKKLIERWIMEKPNERTPEVFFSQLTAGRILTMVRQGMIKPWPLLAYAPIAERWLSDDFYNADAYYRIDDLINCDYWSDKIVEDESSAEIVVEIMDQLWSNNGNS